MGIFFIENLTFIWESLWNMTRIHFLTLILNIIYHIFVRQPPSEAHNGVIWDMKIKNVLLLIHVDIYINMICQG